MTDLTQTHPPEPTLTYRNAMTWLMDKAEAIKTISPAVHGVYIALAGELAMVRKKVLEDQDKAVEAARAAAEAATVQPTPGATGGQDG